MATISTTTTLTLKSFAFTGLTDPQRDNSQVPRQEIFCTESGTIAAAGAGNDRLHTFSLILPLNFAYALTDLSFRLDSSAGVSNWSKESDGVLADGLSGVTRSLFIPVRANTLVTPADQAPAEIQTYVMENMPTQVLVPFSGTQANIAMRIRDSTDNGGATNFNFYCRFLMYDIAQAHHYEVNTPTLTR